jgi:carbamoylphosphate synthase large subunit
VNQSARSLDLSVAVPTKTPRVLIIDTERGNGPARLAIALSQAGAEVAFLCPIHHPIQKTRSVLQKLHFGGLHPLSSLEAAIQASAPDSIIPGDDRSVRLLHELYGRALQKNNTELAGLIARSMGAPESFAIVSSRHEFLKIAVEEGLRVPDTHTIREVGDLDRLGAASRHPWVMKVDGTSAGRGVQVVQTPEEGKQFFLKARTLHSTVRTIKRLLVNRDPFSLRPWWQQSKPAIIAQEYVQGLPANCAVACWEGRILAGVGVHAVHTLGGVGPATVVRVVSNPEMMLAAERIARRLRLSGLFGLDFVIEEGSGAAYLIEMNPRCTPLCHLRLGKGRDMVAAMFALISGQQLQDTPPVTSSDLIAYFPQAWLSKSEFLSCSFQDVPLGEPEYSQELLGRPWPDRSLVFGAYQFLWNQFFPPESESGVRPGIK